jgi:hypothetical protein
MWYCSRVHDLGRANVFLGDELMNERSKGDGNQSCYENQEHHAGLGGILPRDVASRLKEYTLKP